ncbi:MFS transporter [Paenibacillus sp. ACRRX]|uniref:MDR family MFS transporter n=1 Tax=unclassified Paenibacillus TaxID=185978 RepID=UPI001EF42260|nr:MULTISPECIES: MDR family MFS transporter [unclassified Paenibacillus]MCG7408563.1 MFS transporter [Paenibacillus sp. ACRRX]MDK8182811.1 MDR family MFS transporter [Paenibacillus sp. UMB4589-SE434]
MSSETLNGSAYKNGHEATMKPGRSRQMVTLALLLSTFLAAIEVTVVSTAIPKIVADLGGLKLISWVYAAYLLTTAVSTPLFGKLSDLFGRKNVFIFGSVLFVVGSMLCGLSQNMTQMIIFRAIQGIGAGAVLPVTFTMVADIYNFEERAKIQGLFSSIWGIAGLVGPLVGGFFVDSLSWHWIFFFNVPFGIISVWMIIVTFHEKVERKNKPIDYAGAVTFTIGMTAFLFVLITGGQDIAWNSPVMYTLIGIAVVFLLLFFRIELKTEEPMVPLQLFRVRDIAVSNGVGFLLSGVLIGINSYMPLWIQGVLGESAQHSGLSLTPMSIGWLIGSVVGARMLIKSGARLAVAIGTTAVVVGSVWLASISGHTSMWMIMALTFISGLGFGFSFTCFTIIVQSTVAWNLRGASTALNTFIRTLGQTLGIAVFGTFLNSHIAQAVRDAGPEVASKVTNEDLNKLLTPEKASQLAPDLLVQLRQFLENGLNSVFMLLAVLAVISWLFVWLMPAHQSAAKKQPSEEHCKQAN